MTLRDYQRKALSEIQGLYHEGTNRLLLPAATGLGKAQPVDEPVLTPSGWRPIGSLRVDDCVIGRSGGPIRVSGIFPQGLHNTFRIRFSDGSCTFCNENHLWAVRDKYDVYRNRQWRIMTTGKIASSIGRRWRIPMCNPVQHLEADLPLDPYLLGVLLGDGGLSTPGRVLVHTRNALAHTLAMPEKCTLSRLKDDGEIAGTYIIGAGAGAGNNPVLSAVRSLGLEQTTSHSKFIPDEYLIGSADQRLALLQGLLDTDGHPRPDGNIEYCSVSPELIKGVQALVQSLGGAAKIRHRRTSWQHNGERRNGEAWRCSVQLAMCPFRHRASEWKPRIKYPPTRFIESIEPTGVAEEHVCISVDAPDQLYVTRNYIVTHNTIMFSALPDYVKELARFGMLVLVHREELVEQAAQKVIDHWPFKVVQIEQAKSTASPVADIVVASVQTLGRRGSLRLEKFEGRFGIIVVDEAHHVTKGSQYDRVLNYFGVGSDGNLGQIGGLRRLSLGVTATPNRFDGQGLHHFYDDIAENLDLRWGVENGWLTDIRAIKIDTGEDISEVATRAGDFAINQLEKKINTHLRNDVIVKAWKDYGGKKAIAFCSSIQHALDLAGMFEQYGIDARCVHSRMEDPDERTEIIRAFRSGGFPVLTNVGITTEGFDAPEVDTILMARPTKSTMLYQQCLGRGVRPAIDLSPYNTSEERIEAIGASEKPHMMIVDFTDNSGDHELVTAPVLFGLTKEFNYKGGSIIKAERFIENVQKSHPTKDLRRGKDLEDIELIAKTISVWEIGEKMERDTHVSKLSWVPVSNGGMQIIVPASKYANALMDFAIHLERDRLGRYSVAQHFVPRYDTEKKRYYKKNPRQSTVLYNSKEEAVRGCDQWLERDFPTVISVLDKTASWRNAPSTDAQRKLLKKKYKLDTPADLTRGQASMLISKAIVDKV